MTKDELHAQAQHRRVALRLKWGRVWHLSWIENLYHTPLGVDEPETVVGHPMAAFQILRRLCKMADQEGVEMSLYAFEGDPRLERYYQRFGFTAGHETEEGTYMLRRPRSVL